MAVVPSRITTNPTIRGSNAGLVLSRRSTPFPKQTEHPVFAVFCQREVLIYFPFVQIEHAMAGCQDKFVVVCNHENYTAFPRKRFQLRSDTKHIPAIQTAGRLVKEQYAAVRFQGSGYREPLLLPSGKGGGMILSFSQRESFSNMAWSSVSSDFFLLAPIRSSFNTLSPKS